MLLRMSGSCCAAVMVDMVVDMVVDKVDMVDRVRMVDMVDTEGCDAHQAELGDGPHNKVSKLLARSSSGNGNLKLLIARRSSRKDSQRIECR